ncbi:hypothetical protein GIB67_015012 [Kingdonia uniflora]|uniref:Auxin-responsive protein n=1 Tax=Kingdonia uniflora TaxID=39325 RepID=A0A7J7MU56_9MAGN|nr:hypothetical protein GIB67_015012 [Kingdonia uniflora]
MEELKLSLSLECNPIKGYNVYDSKYLMMTRNNRSFEEALENTKKTLPLLVWNDKLKDDERSFVVGWPPLKSWRKNNVSRGDRSDIENGCAEVKPMLVKVTMEGVGIGRKVDLSLHRSYETLKAYLVQMFCKSHGSVKNTAKDCAPLTLTYQDKEGDWLLVGDVPWKNFIESVKRLKMLKNDGVVELISSI